MKTDSLIVLTILATILGFAIGVFLGEYSPKDACQKFCERNKHYSGIFDEKKENVFVQI